MTLDELIRLCAAEGRLNHLTLAPSGKGWMAGLKEPLSGGYRCLTHKDPVEALRQLLEPDDPRHSVGAAMVFNDEDLI
jgi:hypothetical protein